MDSIAIVGISCRFAGCADHKTLWSRVMARKSMLTRLSEIAEIPIGQKNIFSRPYPQCMGQLGDLYSCIPSMQNFPRQVNAGENQDLYFATQLAFDALIDAGIRAHSREAIKGSVRFGYSPPFNASTVNWLQHTIFLNQTLDIIRSHFYKGAPDEALEVLRQKLTESLPQPNAASFLLGSGYRFASWIARECSFSGPATIMDAGVLTGAVAVMDAIGDLVQGRVDVALAGALAPPANREYLEGLSGEIDFTTASGLEPFSKNSSGTVPGEGGAFFVLKRRADALRDRDRIYAVIRSVSIGHNPEEDPSSILKDAIAKSGVPIKTIGLIEADGNGIRAQDEREIAAVQKLWGEHKPGGPLVGIGSVKGNIGHTFRASMAAGLVKAALALKYRVLPPQVEVESPLPELANLSSSAYLLTEARPWITGDSNSLRRAAVLGANFDAVNPVGGTSRAGRAAAIILEEEPEDRS